MMRSFLNNWHDLLIAIVLGAALFFSSYQGAHMLPPVVFQGKHLDLWFESDAPRVYKNMVDRDSDYTRAKVHPFFAVLVYPPVYLLRTVFHMDPAAAVRVFMSAVAFLVMASLFSLFRIMGCQRLDAVLLSLLGGISAASMFFFILPETYPLGALSIVLALILTVISQQRPLASLCYVLLNAVTFGVTISNGMMGMLATVVNNHLKKAIVLIGGGVVLMAALWLLEKAIFSSSGSFMQLSNETSFILRPEAGGPLKVMGSFFYHTLVMPAIGIATDPTVPDWHGLVTQLSAPGSGTVWGGCAVTLWTMLLLLGVWALCCSSGNIKLRLVLGGGILGQLGMHIFYGFETFLYSLHFIVLLLPLVALVMLTRFRIPALVILALLLPCVLANNTAQFAKALESL